MTQTNSIHHKLLAVQKEVLPIKKTEINPYFNSRFFDVNALLAELKPILSEYGLILTQPFEACGDKSNVLKTVVTDSETGDVLESRIFLPEASDPQKFGSTLTYFRRYALQSLFALEAEDDDGNAASGRTSAPPPARTAKPTAPKPLPPLDDQTPYEKAKSYLDGLVAKKKSLLPAEAKKFRAQLDESDLYSVGEKAQLNSMIEALTPKTK